MGRRQTAQLDMEEPEEISVEQPQTAPARRARAKAEPRPGWRDRARKWLFWAVLALVVVAAIVAVYQIDQYLASDSHFMLPGNLDVHPNLSIMGVQYAPEGTPGRGLRAGFRAQCLPATGGRAPGAP